MSKRKNVFICKAIRTPHGSFCGSLRDVPANELGAGIIRAVLRLSGIHPAAIGGVFMGEVLTAGEGQNPARYAALLGGLPPSCPAETVNKVCSSSLAALQHAVRSIWLGEAEYMIAGGMENMSRSPYLLRRAKRRMGDKSAFELVHSDAVNREGIAHDSMLCDGLTDPSLEKRFHMGALAELCARVHSITRDAQETFSYESITRAHEARKGGYFALQSTLVALPQEMYLTYDEVLHRPDLDAMKLLRPAFLESGTVTAATSSQIADGASAVLLSSGKGIKALSLTPLARICDFAVFSGDPFWYTTAPAEAIRLLLEKTKRKLSDIDLFEINEAFAVVPLYTMKTLAIPHEKVNVWGGAIAIGHPLGASGTRIVGALAHQLRALEKKTGIAVACNGGGEAVAVMIERV